MRAQVTYAVLLKLANRALLKRNPKIVRDARIRNRATRGEKPNGGSKLFGTEGTLKYVISVWLELS